MYNHPPAANASQCTAAVVVKIDSFIDMQLMLVISYLTAVNGERKEEKKLFSENPIGFLFCITSRKRIFRLFILTNPRDHDHCARTQMAAKRTKTVAAARPCQNARQTSAQQQHKLLGCFPSVDIYSWQRRARTGFSRSEYNGRCRFSRYNNRRKLLHNENRSEHLSTSISSSLNFIKV